MRLGACHDHADFRALARARVPKAIFDRIDGGADDEQSKARNAAAIAECDLVPRVLQGVGEVDLAVRVLGQDLALPV